jgi:hypothetical protein
MLQAILVPSTLFFFVIILVLTAYLYRLKGKFTFIFLRENNDKCLICKHKCHFIQDCDDSIASTSCVTCGHNHHQRLLDGEMKHVTCGKEVKVKKRDNFTTVHCSCAQCYCFACKSTAEVCSCDRCQCVKCNGIHKTYMWMLYFFLFTLTTCFIFTISLSVVTNGRKLRNLTETEERTMTILGLITISELFILGSIMLLAIVYYFEKSRFYSNKQTF